MRKFDRLLVLGSILIILSLLLPFWAGVSVLSGMYDLWVAAPSVNYYGLPQFGPNVTIDMGWSSWIDAISLTLSVGLIFFAGIVAIFKSTIGGVAGIVGTLMTLISFVGLNQLSYVWVWSLMGPALFTLCGGVGLCLVVPRQSSIRQALMQRKRRFLLPLVVVVLISIFVISAHVQAVAVDTELSYFCDNLSNYPPDTANSEARKVFLLSLDRFIQQRYLELPKFVEYSSVVGHGLDWGLRFQGWSVLRLLRAQVQQVLATINEATIDSNITIWRLYNTGFIVKTPDLAVGFDIACSFLCPEIVELVDHVDVLFVSHRHGDHADVEVLQRAASQGVTIVVPQPDVETAWYVTQLPVDTLFVPITPGQPVEVLGMHVQAFLGPHSVPNYAYLVDFSEGLRVLHVGDTEHFGDVTWIDELAPDPQIDIAFIHAGHLTYIPREEIKIPILAKRHEAVPLGRPLSETALKPRMIIPMHENELGHGFANLLTFNMHSVYQHLDEFESSEPQVIPLAWGQTLSVKE